MTQRITPADLPSPVVTALAAKMRKWRLGDNKQGQKLSLHEAKALLGFSVGYISDLESGKVPVTLPVFRRYHDIDPDYFPNADAGLLL